MKMFSVGSYRHSDMELSIPFRLLHSFMGLHELLESL